MSKGGDNREQRAHIRRAQRDGTSAGGTGLSAGAHRQLDHGERALAIEDLHADKGKN